MGEQVPIIELAKTLIRLSVLPVFSIEIQTVGIRPGEKLYEELHIDPDQLLETAHNKINAAWQSSEPLHEISAQVDGLVELAYSPNDLIRERMKTLIPEYQDDARTTGNEKANQTQGSTRTG